MYVCGYLPPRHRFIARNQVYGDSAFVQALSDSITGICVLHLIEGVENMKSGVERERNELRVERGLSLLTVIPPIPGTGAYTSYRA